MIPINTLCLIVSAPYRPQALGYECVITHHDDRPKGNHVAQLHNGDYVQGPAKCFMPLNPRPEHIAGKIGQWLSKESQ